ncbi:MAG TPA: hypothetical protein VN238_05025 [Solirubrobacteraceae bacterium]|nr:hypothetical protein [Solirubrobacteraceae bacterium]
MRLGLLHELPLSYPCARDAERQAVEEPFALGEAADRAPRRVAP